MEESKIDFMQDCVVVYIYLFFAPQIALPQQGVKITAKEIEKKQQFVVKNYATVVFDGSRNVLGGKKTPIKWSRQACKKNDQWLKFIY